MPEVLNQIADCARCRPLLTKCCTSVVGFAIGDVLAQHLAGMRCVLGLAPAFGRVCCTGAYHFVLGEVVCPFVHPDQERGLLMKAATEGCACMQVGCGTYSPVHDVWVDLPRSRVPLVLSPHRQVSTVYARTFAHLLGVLTCMKVRTRVWAKACDTYGFLDCR